MTKKTVLSAVVVAGLAVAALTAFAAGRSAFAGQQLGITLDPPTATNDIGTDHTVTATVGGAPPGATGVTFTVTSGPNTGATFTCSPNANCVTDAGNQVSGTYTGDGGTGQDTIEACIELIGAQAPPCDQATKDWVQPTPTPTPTPSPTATPTQAARIASTAMVSALRTVFFVIASPLLNALRRGGASADPPDY